MRRLPIELVQFLRKGRSTLVIKGDPGTCKTILSLELLKRFSKGIPRLDLTPVV
ncbi:MAG: hypothetical protein ACE5IB_03510 [Candidatus Geothermarchaeales archaeon]